jgi:hypothetical protein
MKQFYTLLFAVIATIASLNVYSQKAKILGQTLYSASDSVVTVKYFIQNTTNSVGTCEIVGIKIGLEYNANALTFLNGTMMTGGVTDIASLLNAPDYNNAFGADADQDLGTRTATINNGGTKVITMKDYTRSTNTCSNIWVVLPNEVREVCRASFKLKPGLAPETYNLQMANAGAGTPQQIAEFIPSHTANYSNQYKEIAFVVDLGGGGNSLYRPYDQTSNSCNPNTMAPISLSWSDVTFDVSGTPLAVNFVSFSGYLNNGYTNLKWNVENEDANCAGYEVERKTGNGTFQKIAFVIPNGTNGTMSYLFKEKTQNGTAYYRIKQISKSGEVVYSKIITFSTGNPLISINVFPNPATSYIMLENAPADKKLNVTLYDLSGKKMINVNYTQNSMISLQGVNSGMYIIKVTDDKNESQFTSKLLVK